MFSLDTHAHLICIDWTFKKASKSRSAPRFDNQSGQVDPNMADFDDHHAGANYGGYAAVRYNFITRDVYIIVP